MTGLLDETEAARAALYGLLGNLLAMPPGPALLAGIAKLGGPGPLGEALSRLAAAARAADPDRLEREHADLFVGVVRGELVPYASYYLTGFLHEKPLAKLRGDMADLGIARAPSSSDPEDHAASLCEMMAGLITGALGTGGPLPLARQQRFFEVHLRPWMGQFFADLEAAKSACFYKPVGETGRIFLEIEDDAFALAA